MKKMLFGLLLIFGTAFALSINAFAMSVGGIELSMKNIIIFLVIVVIISAIGAIIRTKRISDKTNRTAEVLNQIVKKDSSWNEEELKNNATNAFYRVMNGLAYNDFNDLKKVVHPNLYAKWEKQFDDFENCNPENLTNNSVEEVTIVDVNNYIDDEKDNYTVKLEIMAAEYTIDKRGNLICDTYNESDEKTAFGQLTEYWKFEREHNDWLVVEVSRSNKWKKYVNDELINEEK